MKFIVSSSALSSHLQTISRVINAKNTLPILDCFLFELQDNYLSITSSDNDTTMNTSLEVVESDSNGKFAIASKTILDVLKEISEQPLTFEIDLASYVFELSYLNGVCKLMGQNPDEYPLPKSLLEDKVSLELPAETLLNGINRSLFATAEDELRPVMNGLYLDIAPGELTLVASDGHKLVRNKNLGLSCTEKAAFILPKKPASLLKNLVVKEQGDIKIEFDSRNAVFTMENYCMSCRLIEGRYPNYNSVIPTENPHRVTVDRLTLLGALRRVSVCSSQTSSLIKLRMQDNQIVISGQDVDFSTSAEEKLTCQYDGVPMSIGFKATFLIDILGNMPGQDVVIELADPSRAGVLVPAEQAENEELLMLLMPMMLND